MTEDDKKVLMGFHTLDNNELVCDKCGKKTDGILSPSSDSLICECGNKSQYFTSEHFAVARMLNNEGLL